MKIFGASHLCLSVSECGIKSRLKNFGAWWTFWAYALHPQTTLGPKWGKSTGINLFPPSLPLPSPLTPPPLIVRGLGSAVSSPSVVRVLMCDILSPENAFGGDKTAFYCGTKILQNMAKSKFLCSWQHATDFDIPVWQSSERSGQRSAGMPYTGPYSSISSTDVVYVRKAVSTTCRPAVRQI